MNQLLTAITALLLFTACKKPRTQAQADNPYGLPNATREGKMVFACRVNGQNWISEDNIYNLGGGVNNDTLGVTGSPKTSGYFEDMAVHIKGNLLEGVNYAFNSSTVYADYSTNKTCLGYTGSGVTRAFSTSGRVTLTRLDRTAKIIAGTFECTIPIPNCDTLRVTDGRFDLRYY